MNEPTIHCVGHLGSDPELRFTPNGKRVVDLRIATTPRRRVGEEWEDKETMWFNVSCWEQLADNVSQSLRKGDRVVVQGSLLQQSYTRNDGTAGVKMVIEARAIGADVSRHPVQIKRPVREGSSAELLTDRWADPVEASLSDADVDAELEVAVNSAAA